MRVLGRIFLTIFISFLMSVSVGASSKGRILLIPLDDRPPCLQMPVKMGAIGGLEVVTPPRLLLGRFTEFGNSDEIVAWIRKQNIKSFDAAIVSLDMLAFGGLVASRVGTSASLREAQGRIEILKELRKTAPTLPIYGSSVIMRLAPSADGKNESYRVNLARWAEISPESNDASLVKETLDLEKKIPGEALKDYKSARARNLSINMMALNLVKQGVIDYLILSQDDAKPRGVHVADREGLISEIKSLSLEERVAVQPGADEVSMLLLSRAHSRIVSYHPKVKAIYSSQESADKIMPYEDRPMRKTVSFHIKASGGTEVESIQNAEILFFVFADRGKADVTLQFTEKIEELIRQYPTKRIIIADVDPKGDIQGGDVTFTEGVRQRGIFRFLSGYAAWNTAGNTIGTALPHGIIFSGAMRKSRSRIIRDRVEKAQIWFLLNRLIDDYVYHSIVRSESISYAKSKGWNVFRFTDVETREVENFSAEKVLSRLDEYRKSVETLRGSAVVCDRVEDPRFILPWGRTFEAEIEFTLACRTK